MISMRETFNSSLTILDNRSRVYYFEIFLVPGDLPSNKPAFSTGSLVDRVCGTIPIPLIVFFNPLWVR